MSHDCQVGEIASTPTTKGQIRTSHIAVLLMLISFNAKVKVTYDTNFDTNSVVAWPFLPLNFACGRPETLYSVAGNSKK